MRSGRIRTAVVGCGRVSRSHLAAVKALEDGAELVATVDNVREAAEAAAERYGAGASFASFDEMLSKTQVDAVVICTPSDLHAPVAIQAANAGKHVLIEKPMANSFEHAQAIAQAAEANNVTVAIAQCRRYFNAVDELSRRMSDLGPLISVQVTLGLKWRDAQASWWKDPKLAGGLVVGLNGPHVLDFVQMVMNTDPVRVHAEAVRRNTAWEGEDEAMILLRYSESRIATVHLSFNETPAEDRKTLIFENGKAQLIEDRTLIINGETVVTPGADEGRHYLDEAIEFKRQFADFVNAIRGEPNGIVTAAEGVRLIRTLDAVKEALRTNETVSLG